MAGLTAALFLTALSVLPSSQALTNINILSDQPKYARPLSKDVVGISIELPIFPEFAGTAVGQPNQFVNQALLNLKALTGVAVPVRVGGSPEDVTFLHSSAAIGTSNVTYPAATERSPYPPASQVLISEDFYKLSGNFPSGTSFTWGLNLASLNVSETTAQAVALFDAFYGSGSSSTKNVKLSHVEIGNEADLFGQGFTPAPGINVPAKIPGFDMNTYATCQEQMIGNISKTVKLGNRATTFTIGSFADATLLKPSLWTTFTLLGTGILDSSIKRFVSTFSGHHYMASNTGSDATNPPPGWLLSKDAIRNNCTLFGTESTVAINAGLDYVMGETNSASNHGIYGSSNTAEAAIWQVAYVLQQASFGVKRLFFHNGNGYAYNIFQPVALATGPAATPKPILQGIYYGTYIINDFIGSSLNPYVTELTTNSTGISAYGLFDSGKLVRAMLINYDTYFAGDPARSSETVSLLGLKGDRSITTKRFYTPYTNSTSGMMWGGVTFNADTAKPVGTAYTSRLTSPIVSINASEVVMVSFQ